MHCYNLQLSPHILFRNLLSLFLQNYSAINLDILSIACVIVAETGKNWTLCILMFKIIFYNNWIIYQQVSHTEPDCLAVFLWKAHPMITENARPVRSRLAEPEMPGACQSPSLWARGGSAGAGALAGAGGSRGSRAWHAVGARRRSGGCSRRRNGGARVPRTSPRLE